MNYYKLISGSTFVGVATQHDFRTFQHKHGVMLACDEEQAQYMECNGVYYRADWMVPVTTDQIACEVVDIIRIEEDEYTILYEAVEKGEEIETEQQQDTAEEEATVIDPSEEVTLEYLKTVKIAEMNSICNKTITYGIDLVLSDGLSHHFTFEITDQVKISKLNDRAKEGEEFLPYHADDEPCRVFLAEEIIALNTAMESLIEYHVTYFNSLKMYVESLEDKASVSAVTYGMEIPEEFQSEVLKILVAAMASETTE